MTASQRAGPHASTERIGAAEFAPSRRFLRELRRAQDVLEGGRLARRMREAADDGRGISQQELARRLGISQARISAIERGTGSQGPTYELLKRIARACGVDLAVRFEQPVARGTERGVTKASSKGGEAWKGAQR
jgi:ribosome-binding protein aMBF1 (putative translation factor)